MSDQISMARAVSASRMTFGNVINFFAVSWGLISVFIQDGAYQPANKAYESHFLNVLNEMQWSTNCNYLYQATLNPQSVTGVVGPTFWISAEAKTLPTHIPVFGFTLGQTTEQLNEQCKAYSYAIGSKDCNYLFYSYNTTMQTDIEIVSRNPASKLFVCWDECKTANGNGFVINQESMIPWFAQTLWGAIKDISN